MPSLAEVYAGIQRDPFWAGLRAPGINFVPGFGATDPDVLLVGEAPGAVENARGRPFCGPSGVVLDHLISLAGIRLEDKPWGTSSEAAEPVGVDRANAFVTNVVKYRPPGNRTPTLTEILHARDSLRDEWEALGQPALIVCVGGVAHTAISPSHSSISRNVGTVHNVNDTWIVSMYHPAFGLRNGKQTQLGMERDWEQLGKFIREEGLLS